MTQKTKRVVIVVGAGDYTGAAKMAHLYGRSFRNAGWSVTFITGDRPHGDSRLLVDVLKEDGFEFFEMTGFFRLRDSSLIRRVSRIIQEIGPLLVVSTVQIDLKIVGPAARSSRRPYIVFDQNTHRFFGIPPLRWLKRVAFSREMRLATKVIAVGAAVRDQAVNELGCNPEKVVVLPNGIETNNYEAASQESQTIPPRINGVRRILNVGRLDMQKGQKVLVEALACCIRKGLQCDLVLAGDVTAGHPESERYAKELRDLVFQLGIKKFVHFLGWRNDIVALHQASDIYAHSAIWEGPALPLAILEAMASARPVVFTDCAGIPDGFRENEHGLMVNKGEVAALADALERMITLSASERAEMGLRSQRFVQENYDIKVTGKKFVQLCEETIREQVLVL